MQTLSGILLIIIALMIIHFKKHKVNSDVESSFFALLIVGLFGFGIPMIIYGILPALLLIK